jgi:hypothetical protein
MILTHLAQRPVFMMWLFAQLIVLQPPACSLGQVLGDCDSIFKEAQEKFKGGDVDVPIALLQECLKTRDPGRQKRALAYELLGQCYLAKKYIEQAKGAISSLLDLLPNYKPDAEQFSPTFVELVEKVRGRLGTVQVEVEPVEASNAQIYLLDSLKEELKGNAPLALRLLVGDYHIVARQKGFAEAMEAISIQDNIARVLRVRMNKVTKGPWRTVGMVSGIAGLVAGGAAAVFKVSANATYDDYAAAKTPGDAVSAREDTQRLDDLFRVSVGFATGLLLTSVVIWIVEGGL